MEIFNIEMQSELTAQLCTNRRTAKKFAKKYEKEEGVNYTVKKVGKGLWMPVQKGF